LFSPRFLRDLRVSAVKKNFQAGVTLVEMVVVVGIIGLITAVLAPSMTAGLDSVRMASSADNIASFLNAAVNRSERRQIAIAVVISIKENRLLLYSNEPGGDRELKLPDGIAIDAVLPRDENESENEGVRRLMLLPGASVPGIGIQLINSHKNRRIIRLDPMTGFPRIETPKAEQ
jgi:prepilin-type N-terminal cleavage/methylation domain-containing protein